MRYFVDDLQAVEPDELDRTVEGITITVSPEKDSMGFDRVEVEGPTREAVIEYVRSQWGDADPDWFAEWVEARIAESPDAAERYIRAARDLNENIADSLPSTDAIRTVEDADEVLRELEDHARALRESKPFTVAEATGDIPQPNEVVARDYEAEILCHLNIAVAKGAAFSVEGVQHLIDGALEVGLEGNDEAEGLTVEVALCEEI